MMRVEEKKENHELEHSPTIDPKMKAHTLALRAPRASMWLQATPSTTGSNAISDRLFGYACLYRLGLPFLKQADDCLLCGKNDAVRKDSWHYLNCMESMGGNFITKRHHSVRDLLQRFAFEAGTITLVEPQHRFEGNNQRPDLEVTFEDKTWLIDVTIVNPTNQTHIDHGQTMLGAAKEAEKNKCNDYEHQCKEGEILVPFIVETHGGIGDRAKQFIEELKIIAYSHARTMTSYEWESGLYSAIGCTVQRGNALIVHSGVVRSSRALGNARQRG
jgi:hypothetical protein